MKQIADQCLTEAAWVRLAQPSEMGASGSAVQAWRIGSLAARKQAGCFTPKEPRDRPAAPQAGPRGSQTAALTLETEARLSPSSVPRFSNVIRSGGPFSSETFGNRGTPVLLLRF